MFEKVEVSVDIYAMIILEYLKPVSSDTDGLFIFYRTISVYIQLVPAWRFSIFPLA